MSISFFFKIIYLFIRDTERKRERGRDREREREVQAEGEASSKQGTQCETGSWVSRITPWAEGGAKLRSHWGCPILAILDIGWELFVLAGFTFQIKHRIEKKK